MPELSKTVLPELWGWLTRVVPFVLDIWPLRDLNAAI